MTKVFIERVSLADIDGIYSEMMLSLFREQGMEHTRTVTALPHFSTELHGPNLGPRTQKKDEAFNGDLKYSEDHPATRPTDASESPLNGDLSSDLATQVRLERGAWLNAVYLSQRPYGYSLRRKPPASLIDGRSETVGTLLLAPPRSCPATSPMPSGPISPNTITLTSLCYNVLEADDDMLRVLIVTALHELALRGISVAGALGCSGATNSISALTPSSPTSDDGTGNLIAGFEVRLEEKLNPKPRISDLLAAINHSAGDPIHMRILPDSGFRVVAPHSIRPKLRIELDAELDWDEGIGRALDLSTKESFMRSKLFSLQRRVAQVGRAQVFSSSIGCTKL